LRTLVYHGYAHIEPRYTHTVWPSEALVDMTTCSCSSSSSFMGRFFAQIALAFDQSKSMIDPAFILRWVG